jgi:hypothetical protein
VLDGILILISRLVPGNPDVVQPLRCQKKKNYFILFYIFFKIKFGNKNDNFGEFWGIQDFYFYFFQFVDPQEELAKFGYSQLIFKKRILLYFWQPAGNSCLNRVIS